MKLVGMMDSPYVRRAAISMSCLGISFEHQAVSVIRTFEEFRKINPVVKAPTLVLEDGELLMDSTLIIEYAEALARGGRTLMPADMAERVRALRRIGLGLAACEKTAQMIYELNLRPKEKQYAPWLKRVEGQLLAALAGLEREVAMQPAPREETLGQAEITSAVAWQFIHATLPEMVTAERFPALHRFSKDAEKLQVFVKHPPLGPGVSVGSSEG